MENRNMSSTKKRKIGGYSNYDVTKFDLTELETVHEKAHTAKKVRQSSFQVDSVTKKIVNGNLVSLAVNRPGPTLNDSGIKLRTSSITSGGQRSNFQTSASKNATLEKKSSFAQAAQHMLEDTRFRGKGSIDRNLPEGGVTTDFSSLVAVAGSQMNSHLAKL